MFEEEKLVSSLKRVGASPEIIDDIVEEIGGQIHDGMTTSEIYRKAFDLLRRHSAKVAAKYSIRRAMIELGPDGFPFEKLDNKTGNTRMFAYAFSAAAMDEGCNVLLEKLTNMYQAIADHTS